LTLQIIRSRIDGATGLTDVDKMLAREEQPVPFVISIVTGLSDMLERHRENETRSEEPFLAANFNSSCLIIFAEGPTEILSCHREETP
jgi:hypothetical protein